MRSAVVKGASPPIHLAALGLPDSIALLAIVLGSPDSIHLVVGARIQEQHLGMAVLFLINDAQVIAGTDRR